MPPLIPNLNLLRFRRACSIAVTLSVLLSVSLFAAPTVDLDAELARTSGLNQPLLLLVIDSGNSREDQEVHALFDTTAKKFRDDGFSFTVLDISVSRNRATATRFHLIDTPLLLCLSARGLIVSRDEKPVTKTILLRRIADAPKLSTVLDGQFAMLEKAVTRNPVSGPGSAEAHFELAEFLNGRKNRREAIPHFSFVAHSDSPDVARRVRAWVALAEAHLWIAEPEKARHEASDLIAVLGPKNPEAMAGGNLVLGLQDATGKRFALARREFEAAIGAAPDSEFGKRAAAQLAALPAPAK
jgi:hypothetical protein